MGDVINLRQFRKAKERAAKEKAAEENRAKHGTTKAERTLKKARDESEEAKLSGHRLTGEDDDREPA
ncbi:MAG: DUF4169 family protein [Pseudomonadota bacterium]